MENKTYAQKCDELATKMQDWLWNEYVPSFTSNVDIANHSLAFAMVNCWADAIVTYADSYLEFEDDDSEGWIDIDEWLKFFETHTLNDCAECCLMFNHLDEFDPFGFTGFEPQLEALEAAINELIRQENR